jgi:hypothetical protein
MIDLEEFPAFTSQLNEHTDPCPALFRIRSIRTTISVLFLSKVSLGYVSESAFKR